MHPEWTGIIAERPESVYVPCPVPPGAPALPLPLTFGRLTHHAGGGYGAPAASEAGGLVRHTPSPAKGTHR
jgi:hypothetical protein